MDKLSPDEWRRIKKCKKAIDDALLVFGCHIEVGYRQVRMTLKEAAMLQALAKRAKLSHEIMVDGKRAF